MTKANTWRLWCMKYMLFCLFFYFDIVDVGHTCEIMMWLLFFAECFSSVVTGLLLPPHETWQRCLIDWGTKPSIALMLYLRIIMQRQMSAMALFCSSRLLHKPILLFLVANSCICPILHQFWHDASSFATAWLGIPRPIVHKRFRTMHTLPL